MKAINIIIVTGLSGSGKSCAIDALEDAGFFCVDNMPVLLLPKFLELRSGTGSEVQKLALGMDLREKEFIQRHGEIFTRLRQEGYHLEILFLKASEETLIKRYSQTRRQHPLSMAGSLRESIREEMAQLKELEAMADHVIDTSEFSVHRLKEEISRLSGICEKKGGMKITLLSFGFKYGVPPESDLMIDVRFIPNPYFMPQLKALDGKDARVREFVCKWPQTKEFLTRYTELLKYLIPLYEKEGKSYLTIAIGCTGGKHRSVTIAQEISSRLEEKGLQITLTHRDIELG